MTQPSNLKSIMIVDDEPAMRTALAESIKKLGHSVVLASNGEEALTYCRGRISAIITDMKMSDMTGMDLFHEVKRLRLKIPVIIMSAYGTIQSAVEAIKSGAFDFLVKPFSHETLQSVVQRALLSQEPSSGPDLSRNINRTGILTQDPGMRKLFKMAEAVATSQATVLIEGESGTGKELMARFIHEHSARSHRPFIAVNLAAIPEALLESELFGFEKGAFTGASSGKPGRFQLANTGTILLDEIGEMQLSLQAKLLRILQEREVDPLGGKAPISLDIRVIATTNRPLWEEVKAGCFREDLYYRLNVFPLRIPPLRTRINDIPLLVDHFIQKGAIRNKRSVGSITPEALSRLREHEWRGNVRELENVIERAILLTEESVISNQHLLFEERDDRKKEPVQTTGKTIWDAERGLIFQTLEQVGWNRTHAARILGISIRTLRNKLREYRTIGEFSLLERN